MEVTMQEKSSKPALFVLHACPFCFKVRLFLLESGLLERVELREAGTPDEVEALRNELRGHIEKITFPIVRFGSDEYVSDSDVIVARFANTFAIDPNTLPTFRTYIEGPFAQLLRLYRENAELR